MMKSPKDSTKRICNDSYISITNPSLLRFKTLVMVKSSLIWSKLASVVTLLNMFSMSLRR